MHTLKQCQNGADLAGDHVIDSCEVDLASRAGEDSRRGIYVGPMGAAHD